MEVGGGLKVDPGGSPVQQEVKEKRIITLPVELHTTELDLSGPEEDH